MNALLIKPQNCRNCKFVKNVGGEGPNGGADAPQYLCCFNPPQVLLLPGPNGPVIGSQFPPVNELMDCSHYVSKILQ
ncbi:MAG TPA: hypothetical protein VMJ73_12230 [Rhizomicrobium sp.]|nr:hypothetical protein [Rhizomicrobium sp.]